MRRLVEHLRSNAIAYLALFVALPSGSYAAANTLLPRNSVGTAQLRNGAVTKTKIAKSTQRALKGNRGPRGASGVAGAPGSQGPRGATGPRGPVGPAQSWEARLDGNTTVDVDCSTGEKQMIVSLTLAGPALYLINASGYVSADGVPPQQTSVSVWLYRNADVLALGQVGTTENADGYLPGSYALSRLITIPDASDTISVKECHTTGSTPITFTNDLIATLTTGIEG